MNISSFGNEGEKVLPANWEGTGLVVRALGKSVRLPGFVRMPRFPSLD